MSAITIPRTVAAELAPRWFALRTFGNEAGKGLRLIWRRRFMVVVATTTFGLTYLGISLFIGGGHLVKPLMTLTLPALLAAAIASVASIQGSGGIAEEINGGTLEQTRLSPASPQLQALGRMTALAIEGLAAAIVLGIGFVFGAGLDINPHPAVLLPVLLTILDALGYGLIMTALVVRVPSISAITHVGNMVIMAFGGMLVPISVFPQGWRSSPDSSRPPWASSRSTPSWPATGLARPGPTTPCPGCWSTPRSSSRPVSACM